MASILEHLGKDTLPKAVLDAFVHWCVWEQGHPALVLVLEKTQLTGPAEEVRAAKDLPALAATRPRRRGIVSRCWTVAKLRTSRWRIVRR